jgi:4-carboxymuconolactone decarboxylase
MDAVEPPDPAALDDATRELVALTGFRNGGEPLAIIEVLAHRPEMVGPFLQWSAALAGAGALGVRRHEIAALRASWHHGSDYEWGNHARYALDAGVSESELDAIGRPDGATTFTDEGDRLVIELVDQMIEGGEATARERVRDLLGDAALVDLVWTVGQYVGLSLVADTLALPIGDLRRAPPHPDH